MRNIVLKTAGFYLNVNLAVRPKSGLKLANTFWLKPFRIPMSEEAKTTFNRSSEKSVTVDGRNYKYYAWGTGKPILLIHGWDGRGAQFHKLIEDLIDQGYAPVTLDIPAHGRSPSALVTPMKAANVIKAVVDDYGPIEHFISHSFGSTWLMLALNKGIQAQSVVLISPPYSLGGIFEKYCSKLSIWGRHVDKIKGYFETIHGDLWSNYSNDSLIQELSKKGTKFQIIHDLYDLEIPYEEGLELSQLIDDCEITPTKGFGHYRILRDENARTKILNSI